MIAKVEEVWEEADIKRQKRVDSDEGLDGNIYKDAGRWHCWVFDT